MPSKKVPTLKRKFFRLTKIELLVVMALAVAEAWKLESKGISFAPIKGKLR
jgi:hypothetical protein